MSSYLRYRCHLILRGPHQHHIMHMLCPPLLRLGGCHIPCIGTCLCISVTLYCIHNDGYHTQWCTCKTQLAVSSSELDLGSSIRCSGCHQPMPCTNSTPTVSRWRWRHDVVAPSSPPNCSLVAGTAYSKLVADPFG